MPMDGKHTTRTEALVIRGNACVLFNPAMRLDHQMQRQPIQSVDAGSAWRRSGQARGNRNQREHSRAAEGPRSERAGRQRDVGTQHPIIWVLHLRLKFDGKSRSRSFSLHTGRRIHEPSIAWECTSFSATCNKAPRTSCGAWRCTVLDRDDQLQAAVWAGSLSR